MSKGVKVHESIREWDGYALFDDDNVLAASLLLTNLVEAEAFKNRITDFGVAKSVSIWNVILTRKDKVNDNNAVKV